jgi:hypothetical protein
MSRDRPFGVRMAIGISVLAAFTCFGAESGLDAAAVQLVGRAEHSTGQWHIPFRLQNIANKLGIGDWLRVTILLRSSACAEPR